MSVLIGMLEDLDRRGQKLGAQSGLATAVERGTGSSRSRPLPIAWITLAAGTLLILGGAAMALRSGWIAAHSQAPPAPRIALATLLAPSPAPVPLPVIATSPAPALALAPATAPASTPATPAAVASLPLLAAAPPALALASVDSRHVPAPRGPALPSRDATTSGNETTEQGIVVRHVDTAAEGPALAKAYELAQRGRSTDAIALLRGALQEFPGRPDSRDALAALLCEQDRRPEAIEVLIEGARIEPRRFAMPAARLQSDMGHTAAAVVTIGLVPAAARDQQYHALAGAIAQRAGRHDLAAEEFRAALAGEAPRALWWVALGASLEQTGQAADALAAYRLALKIGGTSQSAHDFAAGRIGAIDQAASRDSRATVPRADLAQR
jgi:MSHA biogenesis protein MshN